MPPVRRKPAAAEVSVPHTDMPPLPSAAAHDAAAGEEAQVAEVAPCNLEQWDVSPRHVTRLISFEVNGVHAHILRSHASLSAHPAVRPRRKPPYRMSHTYRGRYF